MPVAEQVRVDAERRARVRVAELLGDTHYIEPEPDDQHGGVGVPEGVRRDPLAVEPARLSARSMPRPTER